VKTGDQRQVPLRTVVIAAGAVIGVLLGVIVWKVAWSSHSTAAAVAPAPATPAQVASTAPPIPTQPAQAMPTHPLPRTEASKLEASTRVDTRPAETPRAQAEAPAADPRPEPVDTQADTAAEAKPDPKSKQAAPAKPRLAPMHVQASSAGQVTAFLAGARAVRKGDKLFQIVFVTDAAKAKELDAKISELTQLVKQDAMYEPFLANARQELDSVRKVVRVRAPRAGTAKPYVRTGANVHAGQVLADIE
jgi:hypothetical protein